MRSVFFIFAVVFGFLAITRGAEARVAIHVNLASQTMQVSSATGDYTWRISSARSGYRTPRGVFGVQRMEKMHHSRKYANAPMPHSIFFAGGYAIHATNATRALGRPASHGCIRLAPANAAALYKMVKAEGATIAIDTRAPAFDKVYAQRITKKPAAVVLARVHHRTSPATFAFRRGFDDPGMPLGYAPAPRTMYQWMADPSGY